MTGEPYLCLQNNFKFWLTISFSTNLTMYFIWKAGEKHRFLPKKQLKNSFLQLLNLIFSSKTFRRPVGWTSTVNSVVKHRKKHFYIPSLRICRINKKGNRKGGLCVNDVKTWCEFDGWAWWKNMAINCCETKAAALRAFLCRKSS